MRPRSKKKKIEPKEKTTLIEICEYRNHIIYILKKGSGYLRRVFKKKTSVFMFGSRDHTTDVMEFHNLHEMKILIDMMDMTKK